MPNVKRAVSFALLAMGAQAHAAPSPAPAAQGGLEEVVVTAQRREQNLQQTAVTVTAVTAAQLENLAVANTQDLAKTVPNLQLLPLTANPSTFQVGLRGGSEQTGGLIVSEPVVGLYVDDVYRGRLQGANFQLADVERVEVLRGPQGTLYGRNTFSGAIKIVTRTPSAENSWFDASAGRGSFEEWNASISAGGGLTDTLGASFSVLYRDQNEGWIFNRAQNRDIGREENLAVRGKLAWDSGPWNAVLSASYGKDENDGYIPAAIRYTKLNPATGRPVVPSNRSNSVTTDDIAPRFGDDPYVTEFPQPSLGETTTSTVTLNVAYEFDTFTFRSISGYVDLEDVFRWDIAAGVNPAPGVYSASFDRRSDASATQFTQELQLLGDAYGERLDWIFGLYWFTEEGDQTLRDDIPLFGLRNLLPTFLDVKTDSWAAFGQATWQFTERVAATLGGRYTRDEKEFVGSIQSFVRPPREEVALERTYTSFTPKLGVDVQFRDGLFGYASASKGFKAGGFNGLSVANPAVLRATFEPQEVWAYEIGLKADWLDDRLRTNLAYFLNDISGLQQTATLGAGSFAQQNVGDATVMGLEAEITARPVDALTLFANLGWQDDEYDSLTPGSQAAQAGGQNLPLVPDYTAQVGFAWEQPVGGALVFRLGADGRYTGDHYLEVTNSILVKGYTRYDGFVGIGSADGQWDLRLQGRNLSDEANYVTGFANSPNPALALLRPREWMLRLTYRMQ